MFFLLLLPLPQHGFTAEVKGRHLGEIRVGATPFSVSLRVDVFDANPKFLPEEYARTLGRRYDMLRGVPSMHETIRVDGKDIRRLGAVADGVSRLLLRVMSDRPGKIAFEIPPALGTIEPEKVTTERSPDGNSHWALALYTPPKGFPTAGGTLKKAAMTREIPRGDPNLNRVRDLNLEYREVMFKVEWSGETNLTHSRPREIRLFRPPVVLVHGTYDNAASCWDWSSENDSSGGVSTVRPDRYRSKAKEDATAGHEASRFYVTDSFAKQLERKGFAVFLVNYLQSNGQYLNYAATASKVSRIFGGAVVPDTPPRQVRSHFFHNAKVTWDGGRPEHADRGEGIEAALAFFRSELKIAATQADVVGHSMGGVLARVYARGFPLPDPDVRDTQAATLQKGTDWYRRPDNLNQGDIFRLITIGSTHKGSHIPGLLQHYIKNPEDRTAGTVGQAVWAIGDWKSDGKFGRGAFTDQIPGSRALRALGPTRVPAHAIAGVAKVRDLDKFKFSAEENDPTYRERMLAVWSKTLGGGFLSSVFQAHTGRPEDGAAFGQMEKAISNLRGQAAQEVSILHQLMSPALREEERQRLLARQNQLVQEGPARNREISILQERMFLRYVAAAFHNDWSDFTVSLDSALGGLAEGSKFTRVFPDNYQTAREGVLHGYEPRYEAIQQHVIKLLQGGMENFAPEGFPAYTDPAYFTPEQARFKAHEATCNDVTRPSPLC